MGFPAARVGDMHVCPMVTPGTPPIPHVGGPILPAGVPTVLIGGMPAAVVGNMCTCVGPPDSIVKGSLGVFIGGMPAARMGDMTAHGGTITVGCPTVLVGDMGGRPVGVRTPCAIIDDLKKDPTNDEEKQKQADLQKELDQSVKVNSQNMPPNQRIDTLKTAQHYQKTSDALDNAKLSNAVYKSTTPPGYKKVSGDDLKKFGLSDKDMVKDSGFKSAIYESTTGKEPKYTVAFAGTDAPDSLKDVSIDKLNDLRKDVKSDLAQGAGLQDDQYDSALYIGKKMRASQGPNGFTTTGHSLGGGLASAASASTGAKGTTFNAAGLHKNTTERDGLLDSERQANQHNVDSYQNTECPLSKAQNNRENILSGLGKGAGMAGNAVGSYLAGPIGGLVGKFFGEAAVGKLAADGALPQAYGNKIDVPPTSKKLGGHGVGLMETLLSDQAKDDLDKLKQQFNCP
jgi:uncharacterized Zn-binding protein involved in type VI secretion